MVRGSASSFVLARVGLATVLAACGGDGGAPTDAAVDARIDAPPSCPPARLVYLNRNGGTYNPGPDDDSTTNTSTLVGRSYKVVAPNIGTNNWASVMNCLKAKFAPFDVEFTDVDPGIAEYTEVVFASHGTDIGAGANLQYAAPYACLPEGGPKFFRRGIAFVMWSSVTTNDLRCHLAAQALGNTFGLDVAYSCPDEMSSLLDCGPVADKTFTDTDVPCGINAMRDCVCAGPMQNSFRYLTQVLEPACP
ncbi:MAG TPA: hypothetical protein VHE35_36080 [Kofleriaceae bacterium]|nr:hypothetical protein [Kofleriaceae bacterium]